MREGVKKEWRWKLKRKKNGDEKKCWDGKENGGKKRGMGSRFNFSIGIEGVCKEAVNEEGVEGGVKREVDRKWEWGKTD
jgi:hypothetical protein